MRLALYVATHYANDQPATALGDYYPLLELHALTTALEADIAFNAHRPACCDLTIVGRTREVPGWATLGAHPHAVGEAGIALLDECVGQASSLASRQLGRASWACRCCDGPVRRRSSKSPLLGARPARAAKKVREMSAQYPYDPIQSVSKLARSPGRMRRSPHSWNHELVRSPDAKGRVLTHLSPRRILLSQQRPQLSLGHAGLAPLTHARHAGLGDGIAWTRQAMHPPT